MIDIAYINDHCSDKGKAKSWRFYVGVNFAIRHIMQPTLARAGFWSYAGSRWFSLPTFSECSADEICSGFIGGSWADRCPRTRLVDIRVERVENVGKNRNGRARGVDVRKGKLLAGDSGRKIAEVIDLRRAIYQRRSREDGRGTPASVVSEYFHVRIRYPWLCACG